MATPTLLSLANSNQYNQVNTGVAYTTSVTLTDVSPGGKVAGQAFQTQASQMYPGQLIRFSAWGTLTTTSTPTLLMGIYYGGVAGTVICSTGAITQTNVTNQIWRLRATVRVLTTGVAGTVIGTGEVLGIAPASPVATPVLMGPSSAATWNGTATTIDTSQVGATSQWTLGAQWGTNNASTLTVYSWAVEFLTEP